MTILASTIIDRVSRQLLDVTNVRWQRTDLLDWLSLGQRLIIVSQPAAALGIAVVKMVAGSRQAIPADGWMLLDVVRNMGTTGTTPGRSVRIVSRRLLDAFNSSWHSDPATTAVQNYIFDPQDQMAFFVYPPSNGTGYIEINYSGLPAMLSSESAPLTIPDAYEEAMVNYVMFRALTKNAEWAASPEADKYLQAFNGLIGSKMSAQDANNPNIGLAPPTPGMGGLS